MMRILEQGLSIQRDFDVWGQGIALAQIPKLRQLPAEWTLVRDRNPICTFRPTKTFDVIWNVDLIHMDNGIIVRHTLL